VVIGPGRRGRQRGRNAGESARQGEPAEHAKVGRGRHHLGLDPGRLVAGAQQQPQQHEVRDYRRPAVAHEWQGHAGERDEPGDSADDDERLQSYGSDESRGGEGRHVGAGACCGRESAKAKDRVRDQDRRTSEETQLLAYGGEDEVRFDERNAPGESLPDAHARHSAGGQREERLHELIAAVGSVREGIEPDGDARLDVPERGVRRERTHSEKRHAHQNVADTPGRGVDHHEEDAEEEQARA
jgi:hypothetical protein